MLVGELVLDQARSKTGWPLSGAPDSKAKQLDRRRDEYRWQGLANDLTLGQALKQPPADPLPAGQVEIALTLLVCAGTLNAEQ